MTDPTQLTQLMQRVRSLDAKATKGPWISEHGLLGSSGESGDDGVGIAWDEADGDLIAFYRTAAPQLCDMLEEVIASHRQQAENYLKLSDAVLGDGALTSAFHDPVEIAKSLQAELSTLRARAPQLRARLEEVMRERDEANNAANNEAVSFLSNRFNSNPDTMTDTTQNPPAFPMPAVFSPECGTMPGQEGMTLRDYFAAKAMQAVISQPQRYGQKPEDYAAAAYCYADAMLKARQEP